MPTDIYHQDGKTRQRSFTGERSIVRETWTNRVKLGVPQYNRKFGSVMVDEMVATGYEVNEPMPEGDEHEGEYPFTGIMWSLNPGYVVKPNWEMTDNPTSYQHLFVPLGSDVNFDIDVSFYTININPESETGTVEPLPDYLDPAKLSESAGQTAITGRVVSKRSVAISSDAETEPVVVEAEDQTTVAPMTESFYNSVAKVQSEHSPVGLADPVAGTVTVNTVFVPVKSSNGTLVGYDINVVCNYDALPEGAAIRYSGLIKARITA